MKRTYYILLLLCITIFSLSLNAQEVKTNADGDKIVVYPDGTWYYLQPGEVVPTQTPIEETPTPTETTEPQVKKDKKPAVVEKDEEFKSRLVAVEIAKQKTTLRAKLAGEVEAKALTRLNLQTQVAQLRKQEGVDPTNLELLERTLIKAKKEEKDASVALKKAQREEEFHKSIIYLSQADREREIKRFLLEENKEKESIADENITIKKEKNNVPLLGSTFPPPTAFAKYTPKNDVMLNPPPYNCNIAVNEKDDITGEIRKSTKLELLFTYTRDDLRPYFQDKEHTTCYANVTAMGAGIYVFSLEIAIASRTAPQEYGGLLGNGTLMVILLDGTTISMVNTRSDKGKYDAIRDAYIFRGNYQIPPKQVTDFLENEVDKIRVVWAQGYDTYEIYDMDFLKNHISCLRK